MFVVVGDGDRTNLPVKRGQGKGREVEGSDCTEGHIEIHRRSDPKKQDRFIRYGPSRYRSELRRTVESRSA